MNYEEILKLLEFKDLLENVNTNLQVLLCIFGFYILVKLGYLVLTKMVYND